MQDYNQAYAYVAALTGENPETAILDFRAIHDSNKEVPAIPLRGTLLECWASICHYNRHNYGIFACMNEMDGAGRELINVRAVRTHAVDLDNISAQQNYERAAAWNPAPSFGVVSSPGKYHVYWCVNRYKDNDRFTLNQRKLRQLFDGDRTIIDPTRVLRVPGTYHLKDPSKPHLVTCHALAGYGQRYPLETLEAALAGVNVIDGGAGQRHDLGEPSLAAPSLDWIRYALSLADPNDLDRAEWIALSAAIKQAAWTLADEPTLFNLWSEWCARYAQNDLGENLKQWNSIRTIELGWQSVVNRIPSLKAAIHLDGKDKSHLVQPQGEQLPLDPKIIPPMPEPPPLDCSGHMLTDLECREWFKGCIYVTNLGAMMTPDNRFLNQGQFNVAYGGKQFIWTQDGKVTDEAWKAATRSTLWTVPKVDHIRFIPSRPHGELIIDDMGRRGVNTYRPANIVQRPGDATPFLRHIAEMLPNPNDQKILLDYLAHNVKYPGFKIPWAPVIQSEEGAGKGVLKLVMGHCMGRSYTYFPNAKDLADSGAKFNAWMRNKLFILADEIKVDDRRDMIEVLKPMISEETIEIQGKGENQDIEDNFANWCFFSNWKDAIPVSKNSRRFAIFYSVIQSVADLQARGMNEAYFTALYNWLKADGTAIVANFLFNYPIERGLIPMRAPDTSSTSEAVNLSRGSIEQAIAEAVEDGLPGFRGGFVSTIAVASRIKAVGHRSVAPRTIETILGQMGYKALGRAPRPYFQEDAQSRPYLYHTDGSGRVEDYGRVQGWE
jgi:hypothetical protein